ncbi:hypothetical protein [Paenibacillus hexagrammi]|uniref:Butirosin biosynthesis protein H N-terminal domain-containing protein n=1 Tax=Paenibacillus hexagrammi TaxID=2908839 RepID=A0ABY3SEI7_9BACL|nr:hypothetical protein [Paenibacillus sp. YPD9-1]UJF31850.1 hypothetical protein L0M14_19055 [Paenibacillus sp. YPD9-1]
MVNTILPIHTDPIIKGRHHYACMLSIITSYPCHQPWLYNNFIQLQLGTGDSNNALRFYNSETPMYYSAKLFMESLKYDTLFALKPSNYSDFIVESISKEKYIYLFIDKYYIPNTPFHKTQNRTMDLLIYGYDHPNRMFKVMSYNEKNAYDSIDVPYEAIEEGLKQTPHDGWCDNFYLLKYKNDENQLMPNYIREMIIDYIHSNNTSERLGIHGKDEDIRLSSYTNEYTFGVNAVKLATENLIKEPYFNDCVTVLTTIRDHKKMMLKRIEYMVENCYLDNDYQYSEILKLTEIARNYSIRYRLSRKKELFGKIHDILDEVLQKELRILIKVVTDLS